MPMNNRLLRPRQTIHAEAAGWANRVRTNGGTVSGTTLSAVDRFCKAIAAAGIRDRFYRLNLFAGTGLSACLVPLYRGPSSTGTQYGNTTETNNNFVAGDYNETGSSSGLTGNGVNKWLNTGFPANFASASNAHLGIGILNVGTTGGGTPRDAIGAWNNGANAFFVRLNPPSGGLTRAACFTRLGTATDQFGDATTLAAGNTVASYPTMYRNGSATGVNATTSADYPSAHSMGVFALFGSNTTAYSFTDARFGWYSIGLAMTASQVSSFNNALVAFASALSRS